jgi:hypothetical protein
MAGCFDVWIEQLWKKNIYVFVFLRLLPIVYIIIYSINSFNFRIRLLSISYLKPINSSMKKITLWQNYFNLKDTSKAVLFKSLFNIINSLISSIIFNEIIKFISNRFISHIAILKIWMPHFFSIFNIVTIYNTTMSFSLQFFNTCVLIVFLCS